MLDGKHWNKGNGPLPVADPDGSGSGRIFHYMHTGEMSA